MYRYELVSVCMRNKRPWEIEIPEYLEDLGIHIYYKIVEFEILHFYCTVEKS